MFLLASLDAINVLTCFVAYRDQNASFEIELFQIRGKIEFVMDGPEISRQTVAGQSISPHDISDQRQTKNSNPWHLQNERWKFSLDR